MVQGTQYTITEVPNEIDATHDGDCAYAVEGYYPLYLDQATAEANSPSSQSHTHTFNGDNNTYYMPSGGVENTDFYHGTYTGNACLGPYINFNARGQYWDWD